MNRPHALVIELVDFVQNGVRSASLNKAMTASGIDPQRLRVIGIKLLGWLRCESEWKAMRQLHWTGVCPLDDLNPDFDWHNDLLKLINEDEAFGSLLIADRNTIRINPTILVDEVSRILTTAVEGYKPRLMTKRRDSVHSDARLKQL